jgi:hypothetical protein
MKHKTGDIVLAKWKGVIHKAIVIGERKSYMDNRHLVVRFLADKTGKPYYREIF